MKKVYLLLCLAFTLGMYSQQCPEVVIEDEQLLFISTFPLEFEDDEIEIETDDDNEPEYEFEDFYTTTSDGVLYYVYVFELDEGPEWNGITPFIVEFENPEFSCTYPQETLGVISTTNKPLSEYTIRNNRLEVLNATHIQLYDMTGKMIKEAKYNSIDISYLSKGLYIALVSDGHKKASIKLIL